MALPDVKERWTSRINEVTIGATKDEGGTRGKTVTVGGQSTLPFMTFEGEIPNKPVIAGYVADEVPDWPDFLKDAIGSETNSAAEWAQKCVSEYGVDMISLRMLSADHHPGGSRPELQIGEVSGQPHHPGRSLSGNEQGAQSSIPHHGLGIFYSALNILP